MNVHTTRLSIMLALWCLTGVSVFSSEASAQGSDDFMNLSFDVAVEPVDVRAENQATRERKEQTEKRLAPYLAAGGVVLFVLTLLVSIGFWKVFTKAGKPGWAIFVPIYNAIVVLEICGRPLWWVLLMMIPFVNFVIALIVLFDLAKSFGRGPLFGIGLAFFGCNAPILGFGSAKYDGPAAA